MTSSRVTQRQRAICESHKGYIEVLIVDSPPALTPFGVLFHLVSHQRVFFKITAVAGRYRVSVELFFT